MREGEAAPAASRPAQVMPAAPATPAPTSPALAAAAPAEVATPAAAGRATPPYPPGEIPVVRSVVSRGPTYNAGGLSRAWADNDAVAAKEGKTAQVTFVLYFHVDYGQRVKVVGTGEPLGAWRLAQAPHMVWSEGDRWEVTLELPAGAVVEYKYVVVDNTGTAHGWQTGNNNVLAVKPNDTKVEVIDNWRGDPGAALVAGDTTTTREMQLQEWAAQQEALVASARAELRRTRMELASAQEDARMARADVAELKSQLARQQTDLLQAERAVRASDRTNKLLRARLAESSLTFHKAFQTASRLLSKDAEQNVADDSTAGDVSASSAHSLPSTAATPSTASHTAAGAPAKPLAAATAPRETEPVAASASAPPSHQQKPMAAGTSGDKSATAGPSGTALAAEAAPAREAAPAGGGEKAPEPAVTESSDEEEEEEREMRMSASLDFLSVLRNTQFGLRDNSKGKNKGKPEAAAATKNGVAVKGVNGATTKSINGAAVKGTANGAAGGLNGQANGKASMHQSSRPVFKPGVKSN